MEEFVGIPASEFQKKLGQYLDMRTYSVWIAGYGTAHAHPGKPKVNGKYGLTLVITEEGDIVLCAPYMPLLVSRPLREEDDGVENINEKIVHVDIPSEIDIPKDCVLNPPMRAQIEEFKKLTSH